MTDKTLSAVIAMQEACAGLVMRQQSRPEFEPEEKDKWLKFAENDIRALDPFAFIVKTDSAHADKPLAESAVASLTHRADCDMLKTHNIVLHSGSYHIARICDCKSDHLADGKLESAIASHECGSVPWENFPSYLIDHCEGNTITEEGLQHALAAMLKNAQYNPPSDHVAVISAKPDFVHLAEPVETATDTRAQTAEPAAWMNPNESFAPDAFIWNADDIHPEYNVPVFTHPAKTEQPSPSASEAWRVGRETVVEIAGQRPILGYCYPVDWETFDSFESCCAFIREMNLELGWCAIKQPQRQDSNKDAGK